MKLYRLKKSINDCILKSMEMRDAVKPMEYWEKTPFPQLEALEEVDHRMEISMLILKTNEEGVQMIPNDDKIKLCEQALNGELFTEHQMKLYGVWKRKNPMGTVEKWLKQEA